MSINTFSIYAHILQKHFNMRCKNDCNFNYIDGKMLQYKAVK